ncbi:cytochrome c [Gemmata sp. JC717]|uniref:cytochrome c n=1 Tax=Gemmata algarum TaxID=2975278 RepID=UPI0021BA785F|nr:cytochrome c [Gemmata algarum]MDY3554102.1 cytochrome c [Gemmata algarum]
MTYSLRLVVGCAALAAGLWTLAGNGTAGTPGLPTDSYKKAAEADLKFLQKRLSELAKSEEPSVRSAKPAVAVTLLIAAYADVLGDKALKDDVLKVGEAINAKKYKDADALAQKLAIKPGSGKAGGELPKLEAFEKAKDKDVTYLPTTMKLFSNTTVLKLPSGMNIEKDLKDWTAKGSAVKLDPAAVELLAVRSAVLNEYAHDYPNEKARTSPQNLKEWQKFSKDSVDLSKDLIAEATKKAPDFKALRTKLTALEATCTNCHGKYRFDD